MLTSLADKQAASAASRLLLEASDAHSPTTSTSTPAERKALTHTPRWCFRGCLIPTTARAILA